MQGTRGALALLLLAFGSQAKAATYAWCQLSGGNYESYLSGIVEIDDTAEAFRAFSGDSFGKAFDAYVRERFDPNAGNLVCTRESSLLFAEDHVQVMINANPGIKFIRTEWRPLSGQALPSRKQDERKQGTSAPAGKEGDVGRARRIGRSGPG